MITLNFAAETIEELRAKLEEFISLFHTTAKETPVQTAPAAPINPAVPSAVPTASVTGTQTTPATPATSPVSLPTAPAPAVSPVPLPTAPVPAASPVPLPTAAAPTYELETLARACGTLVDAGRDAEVQELLTMFGINALNALPQAQYGAFASMLRQKGVTI